MQPEYASGASSSEKCVEWRKDGWAGEIASSSTLYAWLAAGGHAERLMSTENVEHVLKASPRTRSMHLTGLPGATRESEDFFLKLYDLPGIRGVVNRLVGRHRAPRVWRLSWAMIRAGVPIPRPHGYFVPSPRWSGRQSLFLSEWISQTRHATELARDADLRHHVIESRTFCMHVADIVASMHNAMLYHGDLKWSNIICDHADGIWLVDFDASHQEARPHEVAAARDLGRFLADASTYETSETWRQAFLDRYVQQRAGSAVEAIRYVRRFSLATQRRHHRQRAGG